MNITQLATIGLPEDATEQQIDARLAQLTAPTKSAGTVNGLLVPPHLDPARVNARFAVMTANGTGPEIAARLALDAEESQVIRDRENGVAPASL